MGQAPSGPEPTGLSIGTHLDPGDGACVMEVVSQTAGEPWTDAPACTHPLLARLARLVNDNLQDQPRQELYRFVPVLAAARSDDPASYPRLALACTEYAMRHRDSMWLSHLRRAAAAHLRREGEVQFGTHNWMTIGRRRLYQSGPATHAVEAAVAAVTALPGPQREVALVDLLDLGVRAIAGGGEAPGVLQGASLPGSGPDDEGRPPAPRRPPGRRAGPDGTTPFRDAGPNAR